MPNAAVHDEAAKRLSGKRYAVIEHAWIYKGEKKTLTPALRIVKKHFVYNL